MTSTVAMRSGEEVTHPYMKDGCNGDLLRVFGVVEDAPARMTEAELGRGDIVEACGEVAEEEAGGGGGGGDEQDGQGERWDPKEAWDEKLSFLEGWSSLPTSMPVPHSSPLTDSIVTACACLLLSGEAFRGLFVEEDPELLPADAVFEDPYLGGLVGMAIVKACDRKLGTYRGGGLRDDEALGKAAYAEGKRRLGRAAKVRGEEKASLLKLKKAVIDAMDEGERQGEGEVEEEEEDNRGSKRIKL